jgi:hypothetical protein
MSASSWFGVMRAEFGKRRTVRRSSDIEHATGKVVKRARGIFAPRMVVLKSASDVWRETVSRLAGAADILLIDVSVPSDNLLWEISTIRAEQRRRWILIGQRDRIAELVARAGTANRGLDGTLAGLLDGEEILTYDSTSRQALSQFARSLRTMCQNIADRAA